MTTIALTTAFSALAALIHTTFQVLVSAVAPGQTPSQDGELLTFLFEAIWRQSRCRSRTNQSKLYDVQRKISTGGNMPIVFEEDEEVNEVVCANGRLPDHVYVSRSFCAPWGRDSGYPSRFVYKVFDETEDFNWDNDWEWTDYLVSTTPRGRKQLRLHVARHAGAVREIVLQRVPTDPGATKVETMLCLDRYQSTRLINLIKSLDSIPPEGERARIGVSWVWFLLTLERI